MIITIDNNKIVIPNYGEFNEDGSDFTDKKLLEILDKIKNKETITVDPKLVDDDRKKCELIKEILETYIVNYFEDDSNDNVK